MKFTGLEEQVEYGLETIDPNRKIEVSLRDLIYAYKTIGLLLNFFHQPLHFPTLDSVEHFLGDGNQGAYHLLSEIYYSRLYNIWPEDIRIAFQQNRFDNPNPPYYYQAEAE